jgi:hypothetical protein
MDHLDSRVSEGVDFGKQPDGIGSETWVHCNEECLHRKGVSSLLESEEGSLYDGGVGRSLPSRIILATSQEQGSLTSSG